jgi:iron complex transport system ATP-binding protein
MIKLEDISISYVEHVVLRNVTTEFRPGQLTALIGRNGSGKSTLLRAIAGLNHKYTGRIFIGDEEISRMKAPEMARRLAFVNTQRARIANLRCEDVVAIGRAPYTNWIGRMQSEDREVVMRSLDSVGMSSYAQRTMDTMSDGECQRIMIARALAQSTPVILLDEPTSFLDMPNRYELVDLLRRLAHEEGKTILFSTHELDVATQMCDNIALIDNRSLHNLPVGEMIESGHIQRLFRLPERVVEALKPIS